MEFFEKIKSYFLETIFPSPELPTNIQIHNSLFCPVCRARQARNVKICHKDAQYKLGAATAYDENIKKLIWRLKYRGKTGIAPMLAEILTRYIKNSDLKIDGFSVMPMPLSQKRERGRGYNQATLIAKKVADDFKLELSQNVLLRIKDAPPQAEAGSWEERKKNIAGAFAIATDNSLSGKNVILIDDVFTSGSTMTEAVRTLKLAGVKRVIGLVVAKAG